MVNFNSPRALQSIFILLAVCFIVGILPSVSAFDWDDGLPAYYKLDGTSGDVVDATGNGYNGTNNGTTRGIPGKINNSFNWTTATDMFTVNKTIIENIGIGDFAFGLWMNSSSTSSNMAPFQIYKDGYPYGYPGPSVFFNRGGSGVINFRVNSSDPLIYTSTKTYDGDWHYYVFQRESNNLSIWIDGVLKNSSVVPEVDFSIMSTLLTFGSNADGVSTSQSYYGQMDEIGFWNRSLNSSEISELYNFGDGLSYNKTYISSNINVFLDFPPSGVLLSDVGYTFIANYTPVNYNLTNATYYIWKLNDEDYEEFSINTTTNVTTNSSSQFIDSFVLGKYKWNVLACGDNETGTLCAWAPANYTFEIGASIDYEEYSNSTYATTSETFDINISLLSGVILYEATLNYNGTEYLGTITDLGSELYSITRTIDIPSVDSETDIVFYWTFNYDDGGTTSQNSTSHNQIILNLPTIIITDGACGAGFFSSVFYNFSNSENLTTLNSDIAYNFKFGIGSLNDYVVNGELTNKTSFRICINESIDTYKLGYGEIEYGATDYIDRRYYMYEGQSLSNETQANHTLYLLPTTSSTSFIFEFKNTFLNPYTDKLVTLLRWYPEQDEYKVVEMAKTDDAGKTVMKVHTEDVDYRVGLYYLNGSLIKLADPVRMACLVDPCTYTLKVIHDPVDFDLIYNIESSLTWDEDNNRFVYVFNDPSQLTSQMRLHVYKDAGFQEILICNDTATGYTGVLTCNIGNYTGTIIAKVYRSASPEWPIASLYHSIRTGIESSFGLFASFLIVLTSALVGVFSPIGSIVLLLLGLIPAVFFGSITFAVFMGIGVLGGIIINVIKNYS